MNRRLPMFVLFVMGGVVLSIGSAFGQGGGGRGNRGGGGGMSFDPAEILKRADDNNNGIIEPNEVSNRNRMFIERAVERAKLDITKAMPIDKLLPAMQANFDDFRKQQETGRAPGSPPSSSPSAGSSSIPRPTSGFGPPAAGAPAATSSGFGSSSSRAGSIMSLETKFDQSVIDYVQGTLLREQDKNGDGYIDKAEWAGGNWSKSNPPENSDLNKDSKLSREELCIRISKSRGIPIKGETASSTPSAPSSSYGPPSGSSVSSSSGAGEQVKKYAEGLLKQHDKNKDGMLQRDEWKEMKTEHQGADSNSDGTITLAELTTRISAYSSGGAGSSPLSSSSSPSGFGGGKSFRGGGDKTASATKKSYRFLTPTERLPKGMPDWFIKSDADGDGQIMMAEYASSFTDTIAAEFAKLDLDGDGIITPNECMAGEKK